MEDAEKTQEVEGREAKKKSPVWSQRALSGIARRDGKLSKSEIRCLELRAKGLTYDEIARLEGIHLSTAHDNVKKFLDKFKELGEVEEFRAMKADLIDAMQLKALKSMADEGKHAKASLSNLAYTFNSLHQAGRLERNQSTSNVSVRTYTQRATTEDIDDDEA